MTFSIWILVGKSGKQNPEISCVTGMLVFVRLSVCPLILGLRDWCGCNWVVMWYSDAMKRVLCLVIVGVCAFGSAYGAGVDSLENMVGKWVDLRGQIAAEKRQWKRQQEALQREIDLLSREKKQLDIKISSANSARQSLVQDVAELETRKAHLAKIIADINKSAVEAMVRIKRLLTYVPNVLKSDDLRFFDDVGYADNGAVSAVRRMQAVLVALGEIEALENSNHAVREILSVDGERREMDVVYLGLARGFAVSPDNSVAAVGVPAAGGWKWTRVSEKEQNIRRFFEVCRNEAAPQLVRLPVGGTAKKGVHP
jgi:hypothetical protein